jgi:flavin-dependent dehydrogenase
MRPKSGGLRGALHHYLRDLGAGDEHGFVIPIAPRRTFARGRVLLAGDAAGLADPVTGEGISWAMQSGRAAAEAILDGRFDPALARRSYVHRLRREILPELRIARALANVLYRRPKLAGRLFERSGRALCEAMTDVVCGERTYRELVYSPRSYVAVLRAQLARA